MRTTALSTKVAAPSGPSYFPLVLLCSALAVGIVADRSWPLAAEAWWLAAAAGVAIWLLLWLVRLGGSASWLLLFSVLAAGGAWHHAYWRLYESDEIGLMVDETVRPICVEATAITSPRWIPAPPPTPLRTIPQGEQNELLVWITAVRDGQTFRPASGWATLEVQGTFDAVRAGDRMRVMAQAAKPAAPLNPGEFDFAAYNRSQRIGCRLATTVDPERRCQRLTQPTLMGRHERFEAIGGRHRRCLV